MKKKLIVTLVLSVLLLLTLVMALAVYAQGQGDDRNEEDGGIGGLGLADPPPPGFSVLYTFSGAADTQNSTNTSATSVHCTNAGTANVQIMVQISDFDNVPTISGTLTIGSNQTATFSSHATIFYTEDVFLTATTDDINQGSGRVLINPSSAKVICAGQVLDPLNNPPEYVINLDLFRP